MFQSVLQYSVLTVLFLFFGGLCINSSDCLRIAISDIRKPYNSNNNNNTSTQNSTLPITFIHTVSDSNFNASSDLNASVIYRKILNVTCEGEEPIEWIYEGGGSPSKVIEKARRQENTTISQLLFETLEKSRDFSLHTGKYICRSINDHSVNASVYIYFPGVGEKLFVGEKDEDLPEVLYLPECVDNNSVTKSINPNLELEMEEEDKGKEFEGCPKFVVPCLSTTPFVNVSLFRRTYKGVLEPLNLTYNSQVGFTLELDKKYSDPQYYYSLAGEYLCVASKSESSSLEPASRKSRKLKSKSKANIRTRTSASSSTMSSSVSSSSSYEKSRNVTKVFYVYPPRTVKPTPTDSIVYIGQLINFTCESSEPVMIKEIEFHLPTYFEDSGENGGHVDEVEADAPEVEETTETIPLNKHVANFIDTNPVTGSYGTFQCISESSKPDSKSEKVLHEWKYFVIGKEADEKSGIKYSKRKKSFSCRSKSNQPGILSYIHCETRSECSINSVCLQNSNSCRGYKNPVGHSNRCKNTKSCKEFLHFGGNGYVRCTGELIEEIKKFNETGIDPEFSTWKSEFDSNSFLKSSDKLPSRFNPTLTLKYHNYSFNEVESTRTIKLEVSLNRSRFRFVDGHTWRLRVRDEFMPVEPVSSNQISNTELEYEFTIPVNETLRNPLEIQCQLPERNSMDWKVLSTSIPEIPELLGDKPNDSLKDNSTEIKIEEQVQESIPLENIERTESNTTSIQNENDGKLTANSEEEVTQSDVYETTTNNPNDS